MSRRIVIGLVVALAVPVVVYLLNPFGTAAWDPRLRIVGWAPYRMSSSSMAPTLVVGDHVLVQASAYLSREPRAGDIVVFYPPLDTEAAFVLRIVGVSGNTLRLEAGRLYRDDVLVEEPFNHGSWVQPYSIGMREVTVPPGQYFLLGDNRDNANDSRVWGTIDRSVIVGRVTRIWNPKTPTSLRSPQ